MNNPPVFAWVFPMRGLMSQNGRKFPNEWVCAPGQLRVLPSDLLGSSTWLFTHHQGKSLLFGHMVVEKVEELTEGMDAGALVLSADKEATFQILPQDPAEHQFWEMRRLPSEAAMFPATAQIIGDVRMVLEKNRMLAHGPVSMGSYPLEKNEESFAHAEARARYLSALRTIPLGEMKWRARTPDLTPYAHAAMKGVSDEKKAELDFWIRRMDERIGAIIRSEHLPAFCEKPPTVDLEFDEVDIGNISVRRYVSSMNPTDSRDKISKTQKAEEAHQHMVKRLAGFLASHGWKPLASRSIDMAVIKGKAVAIFEVKSATGQNFDRQARRGIIQILEYGMWAKRAYHHVLPILVMPHVTMSARMSYIHALAKEAGVEFFFHSEADNDEFPRLAECLQTTF